MKQIARLTMKSTFVFTLLLISILASCGYQGTSAGTQPQTGQSTPTGSCPSEETAKDGSTNTIVYTVSWDAVGADADDNRGTSVLRVSALDPVSGKLLWQKSPVKISAMYQSSLQQVVDGVLYIAGLGSQSALLLAVDTRDGHAIWQDEEKNGVSTMSVCAGKIYLSLEGTQVTALRASDGATLWNYTTNQVEISTLVNTTRAVYVVEEQPTGSEDTSVSVSALDANDGKVLWTRSYGNQQANGLSLTANGSNVYVLLMPATSQTSPVDSVQVLDGESGEVLWKAKMPPNMEQIRALRVGNTIYLNGQDQVDQSQSLLVALNANTGKQLWLRQHSYNQITVLSEQDIYGYQGYAPEDNPQGQKRLCSLDSTTGKDSWCISSLQPSQFSLSATQDTLLVEEELQPGPLSLIQNIYGVNKQNGQLLWKLPWKSTSASTVTLTLVTAIDGQSFTSLVS